MQCKTLLTISIGLVLSACGTPEPIPTPTPPFGLPSLDLPADEVPHDFQTEWWYFNAHLTDEQRNRYTLHDVVFQVQQIDSSRTLYARQVGIGDVSAATHHTSERLRTMDEPLTDVPGNFEITVGSGGLSGVGGETYRLIGGAEGLNYNLALTTVGEPIVHDDDGLVDFGEAGVTYYYSRPRLDVVGTITTDTGKRTVTGLGWFDKQWGDFQPVAVFWDWASVQFDDGTDLMLTNLMDSNRRSIDRYATLRRPGQLELRLSEEEFSFEPLPDAWQSQPTGIKYRTRWEVEIPAEGIGVTLEPLIVESEFASALLGVVYWEAGVDVVDFAGTHVGQGFVELNWGRRFVLPTSGALEPAF